MAKAQKICGVYKIINKKNGKFYIGSSKNIYKRWDQHKNDLRNNCHDNGHLQNAWNKYGENNFEFEIIEECDDKIQFEREQYYLNTLKPFDDNGYNIVRQISSKYGSDNYITKYCSRCHCEYQTFSNLSKYCDECKEEIASERLEDYKAEKYWEEGSWYVEQVMYEPYGGDAEYFWECNC